MSGGAPSLRWLKSVAFACFAAGIAVGLAVPKIYDAVRGPAETIDPDERYVRYVTEHYELTPAQVRSLRMVLAVDAAEHRDLMRRAKPEEMPPGVAKLRTRTDDRIRVLLTDEQREKFNQDAETRD